MRRASAASERQDPGISRAVIPRIDRIETQLPEMDSGSPLRVVRNGESLKKIQAAAVSFLRVPVCFSTTLLVSP